MDYLIIGLLIILMVLVFLNKPHKLEIDLKLKELSENLGAELKTNREEFGRITKENRQELSNSIGIFEKKITEIIEQKFNQQQANIKEKFEDFNRQQTQFNQQATSNIKHIESTVKGQLEDIKKDNNSQLKAMRETVDEKLQNTLEKRLGESFKQVSERLEQVHQGLGEMQSVASDVGDLKKVLSNVKTRGTLGEYQLGGILEAMLSPAQYAQNVATKKGSQANVEYAIRLPGKVSDKEVWIPIDAKYPRENYERLLDAYEIGDKLSIGILQKKLLKSIELFAKDISSKYIDPPHTTDFAVMYLPDEGLYAEVLRHAGAFEKLQRQYKITVTGPTTLSAFLSSLQMGFKTLAVQKRSSEVWDVLTAVKAEFSKFSTTFEQVQNQLNTASGTLEKLRTTRSNVLERKLKAVESTENQSNLPEKP
jgi:DNA recombination protein RmuC